MEYYLRLINKYLSEWAESKTRKPLLLRGARQVGKSTAARHLPGRVKSYVEVKGGMKSLWIFMREKGLKRAVRCSLENFGTFDYHDAEKNETRYVVVCPPFRPLTIAALARTVEWLES